MLKQETFMQFESFIHNISAEDRLAVIYHSDADGLCSALVAAKAVEKIMGRKPELVFNQGHGNISLTEETIRILKKEKINKAIIVDLCVDQIPEPVRVVEKFASLLVIDHHKLYNDLNSKSTVFIKAEFVSDMESSRYPASKLCFDLFSRIVDLSDSAWITAVGVIGDNGLKYWRDFIEKSAEQKNLSLEDLRKMQELVGAVESVDTKKLDLLFEEFYNAKEPRSLLKSGFAEDVEKIESELARLLEEFREKKEVYPEIELVYFNCISRYKIKSALINRLSNELYPDKTVVVAMDAGREGVQISARRQDFKIKVNDLLEKSVKGLSGARAGGHAPAAAARILKKDSAEFKKRLISELGKIYQK